MTRLVVMRDKKPLVIKKENLVDDAVWVCRCGLSAQWPMCDGSHKRTIDEKDGHLYEYARESRAEDLTRRETSGARPAADPRPVEGHEPAEVVS